jgi:hypothetical protein
VGDPAGSNATAGLALRVTGTHKPLHHDKVKIPSGGLLQYAKKNYCTTSCSNLNEIPFLQLAIVYSRVLRVYTGVGYIVEIVERI